MSETKSIESETPAAVGGAARGSDYVCQSERESWDCPHMKEVSSPTDMNGETYKCQKAGCTRRYRLYYDEMQ
jgi:hypothetical protein